jgi:hypothetical protein
MIRRFHRWPFVALIAVVNSSLSPVGRFLKDYLQNDLQQNDFKKSIKLLAESFVEESLSTESF